MYKILDIDLDYFLDNIETDVEDYTGIRLDENVYKPWSKSEFIDFLENKINLSKVKKIKGRIFINHDEAFDFWKELINNGLVKTPFEVYHIDAHADLGLAMNASYKYLFTDYMNGSKIDKLSPRKGSNYMDCGNYLLYAIACHWLSKLIYVYHPKRIETKIKNKDINSYRATLLNSNQKKPLNYYLDFNHMYFKPEDETEGIIQLRAISKKQLKQLIKSPKYGALWHIGTNEPEVKVKCQDLETFIFQPDEKTILNICQSPEYTPKTSDILLEIIKDYIEEI